MAHLQYMPGDPHLVDQLVYELKSKGIFDQFRKECIADVDTRPAYQNLRQRVESSVSTFLSHQCWKPDLNKNQLREKLRKHILDGNYLEQGVERIVDQVVNPKVASVFIPQVEDLVYNYLGITRKKSTPTAETSNEKTEENDLLPTDLEAVSPGSVKSNDDKEEPMDIVEEKTSEDTEMEIDHDEKPKDEEKKDNIEIIILDKEKSDCQDTQLSGISDLTSRESDGSMDKSNIPLPAEEIKPEDIPPPENSPPKAEKVELEKIELPREPNLSTDIPLPDEIVSSDKDNLFKPIALNSDDDESSSDSSLRRNMSPLTPIRNFNNENSCDAMQGFENDSGDSKSNDVKETTNTFKFTIETKSRENSCDATKLEKKDVEQSTLSYQFNNQVNINTFNTPMYDDSSNSNNLQIDYESDVNSKTNIDTKLPEVDQNSEGAKKEEDAKKEKTEEKKSSHKSSHQSRDSHRHSSSSKDKRSDSKHSSSRDRKDPKNESKSSKDEKKKDEHKTKSSNRERSKDRGDKKDSRDSSKHRSSSHKSSKNRDSKSDSKSESKHRSSSSSKHSSKHDEKKSSSSNNKDKEKSSEKSKEHRYSRDSSRDSKSHRSDKDKKSSSKKQDEKDKERKEKKETDDHYSASGRGNHGRRSTDRDSNDGSSSSKGSNNQSNLKSSKNKKDNKSSSSKSDNTSTNSDSRSPTDKEHVVVPETEIAKNVLQFKPIVRVDTHLETPISAPPRLPFVPDVTLKKPRFAANLEEAKKMMKMRKFLEEEQRRMNQEAALLLEFQANVRPSLSQVYSNIPGPELEFACVTNTVENSVQMVIDASQHIEAQEKHNKIESIEIQSNDFIEEQPTVNIVNGVNNADDREITRNTIEIENQLEELSHQECENEVFKNHSSPERLNAACNENEIDIQKTNTDKTNNECIDTTNEDDEENRNRTEFYEITIITEIVSESETDEKDNNVDINKEILNTVSQELPDEKPLEYFSEHEKYNAELERDKFSKFLKTFIDTLSETKLYLINCDTYGENLMREIATTFGQFQIVNYYKNGHIKLRTPRHVVSNVNLANEISLPLEKSTSKNENALNSSYNSPVFSPVKSECSFDLSSDYDAKIQEMVSKTSRKEIMEIILGDVEESSIRMPKIDYCTESNIEIYADSSFKRKLEVDSLDNNNKRVLSPNKIRKLSESDQISSTTQESKPNNVKMVNANSTRSKYLGKARRVGLPKPKKAAILPNSPSSDKSVENYEETNTQTPNGKIKTSQRSKVQRQVYDKSDLYKPKLHYLSRRNNIT